MPISSTAPISALRPGLAKKAVMICLYSTTRISAHNTRNTSIRTRKIRSEDSLVSSISMAERAPVGIGKYPGSGSHRFGPQYGTATAGKQTLGPIVSLNAAETALSKLLHLYLIHPMQQN